MERARRHQRLLSALAFGLLALVAELAGRSLTHRLELRPPRRDAELRGRRLLPVPARRREGRRSRSLLARARLALRPRARAARAGGAARARRHGAPRALPRLRLDALAAALARVLRASTSVFYLVQTDAEGARRPLAAALAVAAHLGAARLRRARGPLSRSSGAPCAAGSPTYEQYAQATVARARRLARAAHRCRVRAARTEPPRFRRGASSGSPSRAARLRSPPSPRHAQPRGPCRPDLAGGWT